MANPIYGFVLIDGQLVCAECLARRPVSVYRDDIDYKHDFFRECCYSCGQPICDTTVRVSMGVEMAADGQFDPLAMYSMNWGRAAWHMSWPVSRKGHEWLRTDEATYTLVAYEKGTKLVVHNGRDMVRRLFVGMNADQVKKWAWNGKQPKTVKQVQNG